MVHQDLSSLLEKGNEAFFSGRYEEAIAAYKEAIRLDPDDAESHYRLGWTYQRLGRSGVEQMALFREAIRLNPDYGNVHYGLEVDFFGRYEEAIPSYKEDMRLLKPYFNEAHSNLGWAYERLGRCKEAMAAHKGGDGVGLTISLWLHYFQSRHLEFRGL